MINLDSFSFQNLSLLRSGELAVRPGFREEFSVGSLGPDLELVAGFSIPSPATGEVTHYLFARSKNTEHCTLFLLDNEFQTLQEYWVGPVPEDVVISYAVITDVTVANRELLICSPHFDSLYGIVGGGVTRAVKVESLNPNTSAVEIPRGICTAFAGRVFIGEGRHLYVSDPLAPRTFVGVNIGALDGAIYSLHTIGGGLVVVTEGGSYFLPLEVVGSAQIISATFRPYSTFSATGYLQTACVDNSVFGLTEVGVMSLPDQREVSLNEVRMPRVLSTAVEVVDCRSLKMFSSTRGPLVSNNSSLAIFDLPRDFHSWWATPSRTPIELVGVLTERDGSELLVTRSRILRAWGNTELGDQKVVGVASGRIPTSPQLSPVVREVTSSADGPGKQYVAVRDALKSSVTPQAYPVIGTDTWTSDRPLQERTMRSRRHLFAVRTDDRTIEVAAEHPGTRLGPIDLKTRGRGRARYTN